MPAISVVIPTVAGWSAARPAVAAAAPQVAALGGELVYADGSPDEAAPELPPGVRWLRFSGADVFELRAHALRAARGDVVLIGEDHVELEPGTAACFVHAARDHPEADGFVGTIVNLTAARALHRASFWITNSAWEQPGDEVPPDRTPVPGSVAIRRSVIPGGVQPGWLEYELLPRLLAEGRLVRVPARIGHRQPYRAAGALAAHFASGRSYGAARTAAARAAATDPPGPAEVLRTARAVVAQTRGNLRAQGVALRAGEEAWIVVLAGAHAAGHLTGRLAGPGRSRFRL